MNGIPKLNGGSTDFVQKCYYEINSKSKRVDFYDDIFEKKLNCGQSGVSGRRNFR